MLNKQSRNGIIRVNISVIRGLMVSEMVIVTVVFPGIKKVLSFDSLISSQKFNI